MVSMIELVWILLPVAAASGWFAARRSNAREHATPDSGPTYQEGLSYLLNEQPDKAIEVFDQMLEVDADTVETHVALGNLFRRRGEVERAIRIHQHLVARDGLSVDQRALALLELGQDYMKAGLFDRAERLLLELIEMKQHRDRVLRHLVAIYQQEKDWDRAIEMASRLQHVCGQDLRVSIAHYYCELAELARNKGDSERFATLLRRALETDTRCVRATLLQGQMEAERGELGRAIRAFKQIERQDPAFMPCALTHLQACYRKLGANGELMAYLQDVVSRLGNIAIVLALTELVRVRDGEAAAATLLARHLREHPSIEGIAGLISLNAAKADDNGRRELEMLSDLVEELTCKRPAYRCVQCGFSGRELHWQCPGCKSWSTVRPLDSVAD